MQSTPQPKSVYFGRFFLIFFFPAASQVVFYSTCNDLVVVVANWSLAEVGPPQVGKIKKE